jgi:hypothetical protein
MKRDLTAFQKAKRLQIFNSLSLKLYIPLSTAVFRILPAFGHQTTAKVLQGGGTAPSQQKPLAQNLLHE